MSAIPETGDVLADRRSRRDRRAARGDLSPRRRRVVLMLAIGGLVGGTIVGRRIAERSSEGSWSALDAPPGLLSAVIPARAVRIGPGPGGRDDVHLAWVRSSPDGSIYGAWGEVNLSRSPAVTEDVVATDRDRLAWTATRAGDDHEPPTVEVLLLDPPADATRSERPPLSQRVALALSNLEHYGQLSTPRRASVRLRHATSRLELRWHPDGLIITHDVGRIVVDPTARRLLEGTEHATLLEPTAATPDIFRWAVDQVRYSSLVGPARLQWLEHLYLETLDRWAGLTESRRQAPSGAELSSRLGRPVVRRPSSEGRTDWPPPPLETLLSPPIDGEGEWRERDEKFVTTVAGGPPLLFSTFLRTEPERPTSSRVFVTVWDPAWLDLDWVAGTMEPRSTEGLRGSGRVPPEDLPRLVAGFNGGFQAVDGAFGMRTRRGRYLPPVPYGATVARLANGRIGLGTWPNEAVDEDRVIAYRQNLTALLEGGRTNPWGRRFWGGVPSSLADTSRTDRTGLCLTERHHLAYFWGQRVTVAGLARAMDAAGCDYAMLLDINFSNTVFETYRISPSGELPPVDRPLDPDLEREGPVPGREGLDYRVQAMAPGMTRVGFPRYIRTELRDFFFLTLRPAALGPPDRLPCAAPRAVSDGTGQPPRAWRCASAEGRAASNDLIEVDPSRAVIALSAAPDAEARWLSWPVAPADERGPETLVIRRDDNGNVTLVMGAEAVTPREGDVALTTRPLDAATPSVSDEGVLIGRGARGSLVFAWTSWPESRELARALVEAGFDALHFVPAGQSRLVVTPDRSPMAVRIFEHVEPVPPRVWRRRHREAQERIDALGLTRHYVQIRHYRDRDRRR